MALSAAERKRQQEAAARTKKLKNDTDARTARLRAEARTRTLNQSAAERDKAIKEAERKRETQRIWGGGAAADRNANATIAQAKRRHDNNVAAADRRPAPAKTKPAPKPTAPVVRPPRSPAVGAPIHAAPQTFAKNSQVQNGTLSAAPQQSTSVYTPRAGESRPNTPQPSSYRDGGKGLYQGSQEYMNATGGKYNPLMERTFGYQTGQQPGATPAPGTAPVSNDKVNTPDQRSQYVSPSGKEYAGPGYGAPQPMSPQYQGNDEPGALGQAENPMAALGQLLNRKKISISLSN